MKRLQKALKAQHLKAAKETLVIQNSRVWFSLYLSDQIQCLFQYWSFGRWIPNLTSLILPIICLMPIYQQLIFLLLNSFGKGDALIPLEFSIGPDLGSKPFITPLLSPSWIESNEKRATAKSDKVYHCHNQVWSSLRPTFVAFGDSPISFSEVGQIGVWTPLKGENERSAK